MYHWWRVNRNSTFRQRNLPSKQLNTRMILLCLSLRHVHVNFDVVVAVTKFEAKLRALNKHKTEHKQSKNQTCECEKGREKKSVFYIFCI